ncbi:hypothetical protein KQI86_08360 [Clostridium sp. MSJ-11]|uniref:Uncharacterized protein n=1 Tax=Clostridium mobile TaxID=2841512 RepID=A0ABS6EGK3_9CLOT|nr:hypothetical protein [Clostridium mobile]MBU5484339.1 hypothetical protein [Clostridium mobile]
MKSFLTTKTLGIIGAISWFVTIILRETTLNNIEILNFILGIAPNVAAAWFFAFAVEAIYSEILKRKFTNKEAIATSVTIWVLGLGSEIIHDLFLNSPFDINDMIATSFALIILLIIFCSNNKKLSSEVENNKEYYS